MRLVVAILAIAVSAISASGKTVTLTPLSIDRVITLADNQVASAFEFVLESDDTVSMDELYLDLSVVEGTTQSGDRFVRSIMLFDQDGFLVDEQVLKGEVSGSFPFKICQALLRNVPRTYSVVVQGGYAGGSRSNTIRLNLAFSWLRCDASVAMADFPRADVVLGYYPGKVYQVFVRRSNDVLPGPIPGPGRKALASFRFETDGEMKVIHNPTFEIESNANVYGIASVVLVNSEGRIIGFGKIRHIETCRRLVIIFQCKIKVIPGGVTVKVLGKPRPGFSGKFAVSARVSEMFPIGSVTGMQTRAKGDGCLVAGPTMIR